MTISNIPTAMFSGRTILRTDLTDVKDAATMKAELERVLPLHTHNRQQIRMLQEYFRGYHPAVQNRVKRTRTDIDNKITVNYAKSFTRDSVGYFLGKPVQYVHRRGSYPRQMDALRGALDAENKALVDYQIAEDCSICGVGYRGIFSESEPRNGTPLKLLRLEPQDTFVVYSSNPIKPPVYAVSQYEMQGDTSVVTYYNVYTPTQMFVFKDETLNGQDKLTGGELAVVSVTDINFGGNLPVVEYQNNMWRLGDWETETALMDAIDFVTSDGVNDIQQAVNSVFVALGFEMTPEAFATLSTHGFLNIANIPPSVTPKADFISQPMNADVGVAMREFLEATLRVIVGVPDRKTRSGGGGDTGDAVFMRDGWQDIDLVATAKEPYFIQAEREALMVMLYILDTNKQNIGSLKATDIEIRFNRNKTANIQSKAQVYTGLTSGDAPLAPIDALDIADLTNNEADVIMRSESFREEMRQKRITEQAELKNDPNSKQQGGSSVAGDE